MIRILTVAGGLAGAVTLSQFPEFSQQYLQRLSGAVDELRAVVVSFDATASAAGLTREEALAELSGTAFLDRHGQDIASQIARYERLSEAQRNLQEIEPLQRLAQAHRFADPDLARSTLADFRPAVPVTVDGLICAAIGYGAGWLVLTLGLGGLGRLVRRRPARREAT